MGLRRQLFVPGSKSWQPSGAAADIGAAEEVAGGGPRAGDDDVSELVRLTIDYFRGDSSPSPAGLVGWLEASLRSDPPRQAGDAVDLVTFHRAKGLEWRVVFVTGLEDGLVPIAHAHSTEALAEERRLLYVACTRAMDELFCSWARGARFRGAALGPDALAVSRRNRGDPPRSRPDGRSDTRPRAGFAAGSARPPRGSGTDTREL